MLAQQFGQLLVIRLVAVRIGGPGDSRRNVLLLRDSKS
jgi:hypothetical protein